MADAMMYAIALEFDAQFWTQDIDYKGLPNIEFHAKNTI
jgi:predicted nucleic acid-binding protein